MTRNQIPALNQLAGAVAQTQPSHTRSRQTAPTEPAPLDEAQPITVASAKADTQEKVGTQTRPALPTGVAEYFLPNNLTLAAAFKAAGQAIPQGTTGKGLLYKPVLIAQADIRYMQHKYNLDYAQKCTALVAKPDPRGVVRWEETLSAAIDPAALDNPAPNAVYAGLEAPFSDGRIIKGLESDFVDWVYRRMTITVYSNEDLKLYAGPPVTAGEFRKKVTEAAREERDEELDKLKDSYKKKFDALQKKLDREKRELEDDRSEVAQRRMEELGTHFETYSAENPTGGGAFLLRFPNDA